MLVAMTSCVWIIPTILFWPIHAAENKCGAIPLPPGAYSNNIRSVLSIEAGLLLGLEAAGDSMSVYLLENALNGTWQAFLHVSFTPTGWISAGNTTIFSSWVPTSRLGMFNLQHEQPSPANSPIFGESLTLDGRFFVGVYRDVAAFNIQFGGTRLVFPDAYAQDTSKTVYGGCAVSADGAVALSIRRFFIAKVHIGHSKSKKTWTIERTLHFGIASSLIAWVGNHTLLTVYTDHLEAFAYNATSSQWQMVGQADFDVKIDNAQLLNDTAFAMAESDQPCHRVLRCMDTNWSQWTTTRYCLDNVDTDDFVSAVYTATDLWLLYSSAGLVQMPVRKSGSDATSGLVTCIAQRLPPPPTSQSPHLTSTSVSTTTLPRSHHNTPSTTKAFSIGFGVFAGMLGLLGLVTLLQYYIRSSLRYRLLATQAEFDNVMEDNKLDADSDDDAMLRLDDASVWSDDSGDGRLVENQVNAVQMLPLARSVTTTHHDQDESVW
eukprot:TRINITY_DN9963_c0_g2_i2.p1 TRINITY_DN9963_c0_g2~~TRINITY_DN9963_c0_g2_i2.p1  ORF type:complete len:490 (+),score=72.02 TRINITY_DN9963_c0_g2_i2:56-1525(+)